MNVLEQKFMESMPSLLRDLLAETRIMNEGIKAMNSYLEEITEGNETDE